MGQLRIAVLGNPWLRLVAGYGDVTGRGQSIKLNPPQARPLLPCAPTVGTQIARYRTLACFAVWKVACICSTRLRRITFFMWLTHNRSPTFFMVIGLSIAMGGDRCPYPSCCIDVCWLSCGRLQATSTQADGINRPRDNNVARTRETAWATNG